MSKGGTALFTVSASSVNPSAPITIGYSITGNGAYGKQYTLSGTYGQVTIPAGASSSTVTLTALTTSTRQGQQTVTMTLTPGSGYTLSSTYTASVTISNTSTSAGKPNTRR